MSRRRSNLLLTLSLSLTLAACGSTSGPSLAHYMGVLKADVSTRCGGGYQVFRYGDEQKVLVTAYAVSQAYKSVCEWNSPGPAAQSVTGLRSEEAVTEYFAKTPSLKACRVTGGTSITPLHSEFTFTCPTPPPSAVVAPTTKKKS